MNAITTMRDGVAYNEKEWATMKNGANYGNTLRAVVGVVPIATYRIKKYETTIPAYLAVEDAILMKV